MTQAHGTLVVEDLHIGVEFGGAVHEAVAGVDLTVEEGEVVALIGESGSGKTLTLKAILGMLPSNCQVTRGRITWAGEDVLGASKRRLRQLRRDALCYVPADSTSLNPVYRIGVQVAESLGDVQRLGGASRRHRTRIADALVAVGLGRERARANEIAHQYPNELSGGMRQRSLITMAVQRHGSIIIADEPTSGLDITTQRQVMDLLVSLSRDSGTGLLVASHDLTLVGDVADRVVVMYAGQVVEVGPRNDVFDASLHPYTASLLSCVPQLSTDQRELRAIRGAPPALGQASDGCRFRGRCDEYERRGRPSGCHEPPVLDPVSPRHGARCRFPLIEQGDRP